MSDPKDPIEKIQKELGVDFGLDDVPAPIPEEEPKTPELKKEDTESIENKPESETESEDSKEISTESTKKEVTEEVKAEEKTEETESTPAKSEEITTPEPDYIPNYSYSVKGEEKEIPEFLRNSITDSDSENKIRDMITKLDGFDGIKTTRDEVLKINQEQEQKLADWDNYFGNINEMIKQGDYDNFFKEANIPEDAILKYATYILDRRELPYSEQQQIQQQNDMKMQNYYLQKENQQLRTTDTSREEEVSRIEIDAIFSRPEVKAAAEELDTRIGKGSFSRAVGEIGNAVYGTKDELTVLEATQEVIRRFGLNQKQTPISKTSTTPNPNIEQKVIIKDTGMPNVGSGASSESIVSRELTPEDLDRLEEEGMGGKLGR